MVRDCFVEGGGGRRFRAAEQEVWQAVTKAEGELERVVKEWTIDIANGVIQDVVIDSC